MQHSELQDVYTAQTETEASFIAQLLESEGIRARVVNSALQNVVGKVPYLAALPRVCVWKDRAEEATRLIAQHFQDDAQFKYARTEWTCPRCAEVNGPVFDICWKCTCSRPESD